MTLQDFLAFRIKDYLKNVSDIEITRIGFYQHCKKGWLSIHCTHTIQLDIVTSKDIDYYFECEFEYCYEFGAYREGGYQIYVNGFKVHLDKIFSDDLDIISKKMKDIKSAVSYIPLITRKELKSLGVQDD